eukprot:2992055-Alexandrium_andersonii.AAC.1
MSHYVAALFSGVTLRCSNVPVSVATLKGGALASGPRLPVSARVRIGVVLCLLVRPPSRNGIHML